MSEKDKGMAKFWESNFKEKKEMWGMQPAKSAVLVKDYFMEKNLKDILIPGIGYGRNVPPFKDNGFNVAGIEVSKTAIELARQHFGTDITIYYGSVIDMPFDAKKHDGVFCYALLHLFDFVERKKVIHACYNQLTEGGYMIFTVITKEAPNYGKGKHIGKDRYEFHEGARLFYYDRKTIKAEFGEAGLFEISEIKEDQPLYLIKCKKKING